MNLLLRATIVTVLLLLVACTSRRPQPFVSNDSAVGGDASVDAGPVFSADCPTSAVFDHQTCISSTNGAVCLGMQYCDSCAMNVATSCTCMPYSLGFEFRCDDPCGSCGVDAGHDTTDGGTVIAGLGGCSSSNGSGGMTCFEYGASHAGEDLRASCEMDGSTFVDACPLEGRIGGCTLGDTGTGWFYVGESVDSARSTCTSIPGATWVEP